MFTTSVMNRVLQDLKTAPRFLVDKYFPAEERHTTEQIIFDVGTNKFRLSPFVSPLVEGQIVERLGVTTNVVTPAYIKDKRQWNPNAAFKRIPGESIGGSMGAEERQAAVLRMEMEDQVNMLRNTLEWMASTILRTGAVTITGMKYPTVSVSFGRLGTHTVTLAGASKWDQAGVNPLNDLHTWQDLVYADSGSMPVDVTMDGAAWTAFRNNANVQAQLDLYRAVATMQPSLAADQPIITGGVLMGQIDTFRIWVYSGSYHDSVGVLTKYLPTGTVIMAGDMEGVQAFGAIRDVENLNAVPYWSKSWVTQDPSIRWLLMQSAPLLVPYRPNASLGATVL
jgi:hypothetical protein